MSLFETNRGLIPGRSVFDLSYNKKFTCDMGELIPVLAEECVPGDVWKIGNEAVIRFNPLVAPILHEVNMFVHYFFVPYRLLWNKWEDFITGGVNGDDASVLPRWVPNAGQIAKYTLWDYFGFPVGVIPTGAEPLCFPLYAYNMIYNEFYRDQTLQAKVLIETNGNVLNRCWEKDYFTSALPFQQRGTAPALPISGTTHAVFPASFSTAAVWPNVSNANAAYMQMNSATQVPYDANTRNTLAKNSVTINKADLDNNIVDLSSASTFDVADLRVAFQIQKWLERNARAGGRYIEQIKARFGVAPRDERLQRPEYIGGTRNGVVFSEVLQTSETAATPQGNMAGHGMSVSRNQVAKYHCLEHGVIMGIMSVMPKPAYQQGIDRQWLRRTKYDFYFPEFANLSEQAIERCEIYASGVEDENRTIFGYAGRYDEMRYKRNIVCADMRDTFDYWHLGREFSSAPLLNSDFVKCVPRKDVFADSADKGLIVNFGNIITAARPMPIESMPGLSDHH